MVKLEKWIYPAKYKDKYGTVETGIVNDGEELSIIIRDVEFIGSDFDSFESKGGIPQDKLKDFTIDRNGWLVDFTLECDIPIKIGKDDQTFSTILEMKLILGSPTPKGGVDKEDLRLKLMFEYDIIESGGKSGWFEDELLDIEKQLPDGYFLKCCFGCLFSDYSVYGHGLFGSMMCFRDIKDDYIKVKTKSEFMDIMHKMTENVQETFLCPEFKKRVPGTGYRG